MESIPEAEVSLGHPGPAILKKMAAVMADVDYLKKGEKNSFHGYSYVGERQVKEALHAAFVKHGIVPQFDFFGAQTREWTPTNKGKAQYITEVSLRYAFYDVETGDCLSGTSVAHGIDGEDKGVYKAITQGIKYALTSAFLIPTGDDAEKPNDYETDERDAPEKRGIPATGSAPKANGAPKPPIGKVRATAGEAYRPGGRKDARPDNAISEGKVKRYWALFYAAKENMGWTEDDRLMALRRHDYDEVEAVHWKDYEAVCAEFENMPAGPPMLTGMGEVPASEYDGPPITDDDVPF